MIETIFRTIECKCKYCGAEQYRIAKIEDMEKITEEDKRCTCCQCQKKIFDYKYNRQQILFPPKIRF